MSKSNIGETGMRSIRIGGMKITDLPILESVLASNQMPLVEDADRQTQIEAVLAGKPKQRVDYLQNRVAECKANIIRIQLMKDDQNKLIQEYIGHISLCKFRDKELAKLNKIIDNKKIKELNKQFPPYNVEKMEQQIKQSKEAMERAEGVIKQEYDSINEIKEVLVLCIDRDNQLQKLGAKLAVGN